MKHFQHSSLLQKLCILFFLTIVVFLGSIIAFYSTTFHSLQRDKANYVENLAINLSQTTDDITSSVSLMAETISTASATHSFLTTNSTTQKVQYQQILNRLVSKLIDSSSHINNILLLDSTGTLYSFSSFDYLLAAKLDLQYQIFTSEVHSDGFSSALYLSDTDTTHYLYVQTIYDDIYATQKMKIGTCIIICSCNTLYQACENNSTEEALIAILDSENQILASNQNRTDAYQNLKDNNNNTHLIIQKSTSTPTNWKIFCSVPYKELHSELTQLQRLAWLIMIVLLIAFLLLAYYINTDIVIPLVKIVNFLQGNPHYVLHNSLQLKGNYEIETLYTSINHMLNQINELTHNALQNQAQMYEIEISKNQAQLLALQTQINPHFLYNTLNSIKGLAYQDNMEAICTAVDSLSHMMRYNFSGNNMTCVKNEFLCIEKYLRIIELRFPKRFLFHLNVDSNISDYEMPRFILQPLVENAISHGLEPNLGNGVLTLTASLQDNSILHFECIDNGIGISSDKLEELRRKLEDSSSLYGYDSENRSGIGLINIHRRIKLIYGAPYGLSLYSNPEGTTICVDFPASFPTT